jgi:hypothetical protein
MRGRFATLAHDRALRPSSGCCHRHRHRHEFLLHHHVGQEWAPDPPAVAIIVIVIDMLLATSSCWTRMGPRPSSCRHHHSRHRPVSCDIIMLGKRAPTALKNGPPRPSSLGPPVLPLGGPGPYAAAGKGVATGHSCGCVVLPHIGHTRKSLLSHSGGWDHMSSSLPHPSQTDLSHRLLAWGALIMRRWKNCRLLLAPSRAALATL